MSKIVKIGEGEKSIIGASDNDFFFRNIPPEYGKSLGMIARRILPRDACFWDIGANIGLTALVLQDCFPNGTHLALEAGSRVFECLLENLSTNGVSNVTLVNACAGHEDKTVLFKENSAFGYVSDVGSPTAMLSAASILCRAKSPKVDFIKIDIEGHEPLFLTGAEDFLIQHKPIIFMEFNSWCIIRGLRQSPHIFADWIFNFFPYIYLVSKVEVGSFRDIKEGGAMSFLHDHLVRSHAIDDLVLSFTPLEE